MGKRRDLDKFIDESSASQKNIVFPDTVRNARALDVFLWKGSPNPPLVQRIAAWMIGLGFMVIGLIFMAAAFTRERDQPWIPGLIAVPFVLLGMRIFRNGFPRA